jgi:PIN domain nuclease of toxin-antitoxin system
MILLDTHVVAWVASEPEKLSRPASDAIRHAMGSGGIAIAAITLWELAQLMTSGRLKITGTVDAFVEEIAGRLVVIPISPKIAMLGTRFSSPYPRDPSDRLIGATAIAEGIALVTKDRAIRNSGQVKTIW